MFVGVILFSMILSIHSGCGVIPQGMYCDDNNEIVRKKNRDEKCSNHKECMSQMCSNPKISGFKITMTCMGDCDMKMIGIPWHKWEEEEYNKVCPRGEFCTTDRRTCICRIGAFRDYDSGQCQDCPAGTYGKMDWHHNPLYKIGGYCEPCWTNSFSYPGMHSCIECYGLTLPGRDHCNLCPPGTGYNRWSETCEMCGEGMYSDRVGGYGYYRGCSRCFNGEVGEKHDRCVKYDDDDWECSEDMDPSVCDYDDLVDHYCNEQPSWFDCDSMGEDGFCCEQIYSCDQGYEMEENPTREEIDSNECIRLKEHNGQEGEGSEGLYCCRLDV